MPPVPFLNTSTKRSSNYAPFVKISKSGDGGRSGDIFPILVRSIMNTQRLRLRNAFDEIYFFYCLKEFKHTYMI